MTSLKLLEFTWKISKYSEQKLSNGPGRLICSQNLPANFKGNLKFQLGFGPHGVSEFSDGGEWTSLYLKTTGSDTYDTLHHFEFSIVDADGKKFGIRRFHKKIPNLICKKNCHRVLIHNPNPSKMTWICNPVWKCVFLYITIFWNYLINLPPI